MNFMYMKRCDGDVIRMDYKVNREHSLTELRPRTYGPAVKLDEIRISFRESNSSLKTSLPMRTDLKFIQMNIMYWSILCMMVFYTVTKSEYVFPFH